MAGERALISPREFLISFLWPFLVQEFKKKPASREFLEQALESYASFDKFTPNSLLNNPITSTADVDTTCNRKGRLKCAFASWENYILVVGGVDVEGNVHGSVDRFDTINHEWQEVARLKTPRSECSVVVSGDDLYAFGGEGTDGVATNICDCLLYTSPSPRDRTRSRMPSSA